MKLSNKEPKILHVEGFSVTGLSVRMATAKLSHVWQRFFSEGVADKIPNRTPGSPMFGVYSNYESNVDGLYTVTVGVKTDDEPNTPVFCTINVLPGEYLVFENQGVTPHVVVETWQNVWTYFKSQPKFTRRFKTDFEMYKNGEDIAIYIGI